MADSPHIQLFQALSIHCDPSKVMCGDFHVFSEQDMQNTWL